MSPPDGIGMREQRGESISDGAAHRRHRLLKALLVFLVLMTGPILCTIFYLTIE